MEIFFLTIFRNSMKVCSIQPFSYFFLLIIINCRALVNTANLLLFTPFKQPFNHNMIIYYSEQRSHKVIFRWTGERRRGSVQRGNEQDIAHHKMQEGLCLDTFDTVDSRTELTLLANSTRLIPSWCSQKNQRTIQLGYFTRST